MATHIPDNLKSADLTRFIVRAAQLEKVKPVMAYWCRKLYTKSTIADTSRRVLDRQPNTVERSAHWRQRDITVNDELDG